MANVVTMKLLLEAGVHFGHQTRRWNPKMKPYIFTERNGIHIIDLQQTVVRLSEACAFARDLVVAGKHVLFIGTKKQGQESIEAEATRCAMPYVNQRWLGGTLTNYRTIQTRVRRLKELEEQEAAGFLNRLPKKEATRLRDELARLTRLLGGIKGMGSLPAAVFVVDPHKERIAISEARRLEIPIIALVDTNCDPDEVDYPIPANDDAIRAIKLLCSKIADAVAEGQALREAAGAEKAAAEGEGEAGEEALEKVEAAAQMVFLPEEMGEQVGEKEGAAQLAEGTGATDEMAQVLDDEGEKAPRPERASRRRQGIPLDI